MAYHVKEYPNVLSSEFCRQVTEKFELDDRKHHGLTVDGYVRDIKDSMDLTLKPKDPAWKSDIKTFADSLHPYLDDYVNEFYKGQSRGYYNRPFQVDYRIQRYTPDNLGYAWHNDYCFNEFGGQRPAVRIITIIWYLNTVDGGTTEFFDGTHIKPEEGKLLLFPSTWCHAHKANPPIGGNKYICTGLLYTSFE